MKIKNWFRKYKYLICLLCTVLSPTYAFLQYNCSGVCAGLETSAENVSDYSDLDSSEPNREVDIFNLTLEGSSGLRFATPCETPNHEVTYCMEISKCPVLDAVKGKRKYADFVQASKCGPNNEDPNNFKVCCGKYNSFRTSAEIRPSQTIPDDLGVLPKKCGTQRQIVIRGRIIGGIEAALGEFPWMARIIHKNKYGQKSYGCGGFLVHTRYVVTAAHCIHSEFSAVRGDPYSVLLGEHNMTTKIDCSRGGTFCADPVQISRINKIVVHEKYDNLSKNHHNDIALIHLNKAVKTNDFVQPICLLTDPIPNTKKFSISGWGKTEIYESSPVKLKVDLLAFDKEDCKEKFQILDLEIHDSQICAGGQKLKDSCNGDSGGPLMVMNGTQYFAAGLVSYGIGCGMPGWPGVYTSIPFYVDWVKRHIIEIGTRSPKIKKQHKKNKKKDKLLQVALETAQNPT